MAFGKILLVDDMRVNRLVLGRMLTKIGFEVLEADNGVKAIELFRSHRSALRCVLLDLQMPVMDGWETAENLRSIEALSQGTRMPIVACTALNLAEAWHDHDTVASSALHSGFDALLEKMPTFAQLCAVLSKYIADISYETAVAAAAGAAGPAALSAAAAPAPAAVATVAAVAAVAASVAEFVPC